MTGCRCGGVLLLLLLLLLVIPFRASFPVASGACWGVGVVLWSGVDLMGANVPLIFLSKR